VNQTRLYVRGLVACVLIRCRYTVLQVGAIAMAEHVVAENRDRIALLFTDLELPGRGSGIALAAQFQALRPDLRVLYTSGRGG